MYIQFFVIPLLGLIRNYIKYKKISIIMFFRTPIINSVIYTLLNTPSNESIYKSIFLERCLFFVVKSIISLVNNDYINKKNKYITKYDMTYPKTD